MKTRLRAVVAATAASALLLSGAVLATAPASAATGPVISGAQLAMTVNTIATAAPAVVKGNSIRLWDTGTTWPTIEPAEAQYNWAPLDAAVSKARAAGARDILYVLGTTPKWAVPANDPAAAAKGDAYGPGSSAHPAYDKYYIEFLQHLVARYKGRITSYELWNESNLPMFYRGTPVQLARLAVQAYAVIKHAPAPRPTFTSPSWLLRWWDANRVNQMLAMKQRGWPFDVTNVHGYPKAAEGPDARVAYIKKFQAKAASLGLHKPIWDTEVNIGDRRPGYVTRHYVGGMAARYVARVYLDSLRYGVARTYWYSWGSHILGIDMTDAAGHLSSGGIAYVTVRKWLIGMHWNGCVTSANHISRCALTTSRGARSSIVYTPSANVRTTVPAHARYACSLDGKCRAVKPGATFYATGNAQLIIGA